MCEATDGASSAFHVWSLSQLKAFLSHAVTRNLRETRQDQHLNIVNSLYVVIQCTVYSPVSAGAGRGADNHKVCAQAFDEPHPLSQLFSGVWKREENVLYAPLQMYNGKQESERAKC